MAPVQVRGTDNNPIDAPRPSPAVSVGRRRPAGFGKSDRNAAALLRELRWLIATPDGADSAPSLDRDGVTGESTAPNVASGVRDSASSALGMVDITWWPADMTSGADASAQLPRTRVLGADRRAGAPPVGGELNRVTFEASAEAPA